jgi:hypothetical protein
MRTVVMTHPGVLELNYLWLPTWIGFNAMLKKKVEELLCDSIVGRVFTEEELDRINDEVIDVLESMYPTVTGLRDFLDGLKFVRFECPEPTGSISESIQS